MIPGDYCLEIERYLCRKNDGHLVRIVGPSFERVTDWADRGIPLKVAFAGIDRYFERYYAKGPRRRPVRIDFCDADVLDVFDEWRRAVGILVQRPDDAARIEGAGSAAQVDADEAPSSRRRGTSLSLPAHITRVMVKLTAARVGAMLPGALESAIDEAIRELDRAQPALRGFRGDARARFLDRLAAIDAALVAAAERSLAPDQSAALQARAAEELRPFRGRMPDAAFDRAVASAARRLVRESFGLPTVTFET